MQKCYDTKKKNKPAYVHTVVLYSHSWYGSGDIVKQGTLQYISLRVYVSYMEAPSPHLLSGR